MPHDLYNLSKTKNNCSLNKNSFTRFSKFELTKKLFEVVKFFNFFLLDD